MKINLLILFVFSFKFCFSQNFEVGETYFDANEYVEYLHGNLPIIISVPHGGEKEPENIPDRICANCVVVNDAFTQELGRSLAENIYLNTGCYPHVIYNRLHRIKLDANREILEAAQGNQIAEQAWNSYQESIMYAKDFVTDNYTKGLFIDLHGHAHDIQKLELGYLISTTDLQLSDENLDLNNFGSSSSIKRLSIENLNDLSFSELLRGPLSLGSLLSGSSFPSVPSIEDIYPMQDESYFSGGYNTMQHGSQFGGAIDAIQIECNQDVRFDETEREDFSKALAIAIIEFIESHYFENIDEAGCNLVNTFEPTASVLRVNPNPVLDFLEIENVKDYDELIILNSLGYVMYRDDIYISAKNSHTIDLSKYSNGLYLLICVKDQDYIYHQKIIKTN